MFEKIPAALGLLICLLLALRLIIGPARRRRLDERLGRFGRLLKQWSQRLVHWRRRRQVARIARVEATELIRRAKSGSKDEGEWVGNVYHPKKFVRKSRKLH